MRPGARLRRRTRRRSSSGSDGGGSGSRSNHPRTGRIPRLERLDALGERLERQVAIGPHHARKRNLERQARIGGRLQLGRQIAQNAEQARQAIGAEQRQLACELSALGLGHLQRHVGAHKRHHVQIAHALSHIAHKSGQVGSCFHILRRPAEARCSITGADRVHDFGHLARIERPEHRLGARKRYLALAERDDLFEGGERVAKAAFRAMRDQIERLALELDPFGHAYRAQTRDHGLGGDATEIKSLAAGMDGLGNLLRVGRRQNEHHMARRLLERLQQRVERCHREHVDLIDDVDLVAPARRRELHAVDDLLTDVVDAGAACRIELVDVGVLSRGDKLAVLARSVGVGSRAALA